MSPARTQGRAPVNAPAHGRTPASTRTEHPRVSTQPAQSANACACGGGCPRCQVLDTSPSSASETGLEQRADRLAEDVMRMRPRSGTASLPAGAPSAVHSERQEPPPTLATHGASGQPLDTPTRAFFETRLGADLAPVRVHTDAAAASSALARRAHAYALGEDIVFAPGRFVPDSTPGRRLLAHELAHVLQQRQGLAHHAQAAAFGPAASGTPANWSTDVGAATTPSARVGLIQSALGTTVTVSDRTSQSASDASPTAAHLLAFTTGNPQVNYDDNLNSKTSGVNGRALRDNAGYTLHSGSNDYIILGPKALDASNFHATVVILNHEFDHVSQHLANSTLTGNASELDAWTSTFVREFHRGYVIDDNGTTCFVQNLQTFTPLIDYYHRSSVTDPQRQTCVQRIVAYHGSTIAGHAGHARVFKFWVHRTMKRHASVTPNLGEDVNTALSLGISAADGLDTTRQFPCANLASLTYPSAPVVTPPVAPSTPPAGGSKP